MPHLSTFLLLSLLPLGLFAVVDAGKCVNTAVTFGQCQSQFPTKKCSACNAKSCTSVKSVCDASCNQKECICVSKNGFCQYIAGIGSGTNYVGCIPVRCHVVKNKGDCQKYEEYGCEWIDDDYDEEEKVGQQEKKPDTSTSKPTNDPNPPSGYSVYDTGGCVGRNELGSFKKPSASECAALCDANESCVSFEYRKGGTTCQLSTSCDRYGRTVDDPSDPYRWYLKVPKGYKAYETGGCVDRNELGIFKESSVSDCAALCDADLSCVSFEYQKQGKKCLLSTSCDSFDLTANDSSNPFRWYLKVGYAELEKDVPSLSQTSTSVSGASPANDADAMSSLIDEYFQLLKDAAANVAKTSASPPTP